MRSLNNGIYEYIIKSIKNGEEFFLLHRQLLYNILNVKVCQVFLLCQQVVQIKNMLK